VRYPWRAPFLTDVRRSRGGAWCLVEERQRSVAFWIIGPVAARVIVHRGKSGAARAEWESSRDSKSRACAAERTLLWGSKDDV
jgi:hypothetical protein